MDEEKNDQIKNEVLDRFTEDTKEIAEQLVADAAKAPWYKKILFYVLALLAGGAYYVISVWGDELWTKLQELINGIM